MIGTFEKSAWQIASDEYDCDHDATILTLYIDASGRASARYQCQRCGEFQGNVKKNEVDDLDALPAWDEQLRTQWWRKRNARGEQIHQERQRQQKETEAEEAARWWRNYTVYLRSPEWQALRRFVLRRDNYTCQGCGKPHDARNLVCHHKSYVGYNRVGKTFGFEVVTLCKRCHDEWHQVEEGYSEYE